MNHIVDTVKHWLEQEDITEPSVSANPDGSYISFSFMAQLGSESYQVFLDSSEDDRSFKVYVYPGHQVPEEKLSDVALFLTRLNHKEVPVGSFDLDMDRGIYRFKIGAILKGMELTNDTIDHMVRTGIETLDQWCPSVLAVIQGHDAGSPRISSHTSEAAAATIH